MRVLRLSRRRTLPVKATVLAMLFYRQEFDADLTADVLRVSAGLATGVELSRTAGEALQVVWAMGKAAAFPAPFPPFLVWAETLRTLDEDFISDVLAIAEDGLLVDEDTKRSSEGSGKTSERTDLEWLAIGKRVGLSFDEMNLLRIRDLAKYVDIYLPDSDDEGVRPATKADIASFHI